VAGAQVVESLHSKLKALSSNTSTSKKEEGDRGERRKEEERE
jgi:hypothetical protein